jgi:hypothetical protein
MGDELARAPGLECINAASVSLTPAAGSKETAPGRDGEHDAGPWAPRRYP